MLLMLRYLSANPSISSTRSVPPSAYPNNRDPANVLEGYTARSLYDVPLASLTLNNGAWLTEVFSCAGNQLLPS